MILNKLEQQFNHLQHKASDVVNRVRDRHIRLAVKEAKRRNPAMNEPVLDYAPGSPEKKALKAALERWVPQSEPLCQQRPGDTTGRSQTR